MGYGRVYLSVRRVVRFLILSGIWSLIFCQPCSVSFYDWILYGPKPTLNCRGRIFLGTVVNISAFSPEFMSTMGNFSYFYISFSSGNYLMDISGRWSILFAGCCVCFMICCERKWRSCIGSYFIFCLRLYQLCTFFAALVVFLYVLVSLFLMSLTVRLLVLNMDFVIEAWIFWRVAAWTSLRDFFLECLNSWRSLSGLSKRERGLLLCKCALWLIRLVSLPDRWSGIDN